jgi:hypothetical protein
MGQASQDFKQSFAENMAFDEVDALRDENKRLWEIVSAAKLVVDTNTECNHEINKLDDLISQLEEEKLEAEKRYKEWLKHDTYCIY